METIPYVVEIAMYQDGYSNQSNIHTHYEYAEKDYLDKHIINYIVTLMYEFCSPDYGHGIEITSYDDFCKNWWKLRGKITDAPVLQIRYYVNNNWCEWNIELHKNDIYEYYYENTKMIKYTIDNDMDNIFNVDSSMDNIIENFNKFI